MGNKGSVEITAKTMEEAVAEALKELNCGREEVEISIMEQGSKGILGIGAKPYRIVATKAVNFEKRAYKFLSEVVKAMGVPAEIDIDLKDNHMNIVLSGKDMGIFIGKRGQTLDSLQYLVSLIVNKEKGDGQYVSVMLDTENYRQRRKETLEALAFNLAKKVKQTRKNVVLEPMTPNERRIMHSALQNDKYVVTYSEGEEPYRNVVISLRKTGTGYSSYKKQTDKHSSIRSEE